MRHATSLTFTCACAALGASALAAPRAAAQQVPAPKLVVLITVDQLRGDYIDRFARNLTGGLKRFRDDGVYYPEGRQDHANTSTAPGHATLLSGRVPARTGIVSNDLGVPDPATRLIAGATAGGASPWRFRGSTLYDWMLRSDPQSRALSVARKDRGAILPIGGARAHVYWWANERFTTSRYYRDTLPTWVTQWNAALQPSQWVNRAWTLYLPESAYPEVDDQPHEAARRPRVFPHVLDSLQNIIDYPWMDSLTLDLALKGTRELELGRRSNHDLLAVSLSTLDAIGHRFGPDSREVHDHVVRIDRWLGTFFEALEREIPRDRIIYVISSDHGVGSMLDVHRARGITDVGRINMSSVVSGLVGPLQQRFMNSFGVRTQSGLVLADTAEMRARGIDVAKLSTDLAGRLAAVDGFAKAYTPSTLAAAPPDDESARLWKRAIPPSYGWLALGQPKENWVFGSTDAEHGTALPDNMHVPIAFFGAGITPARVERIVRTIDIAPTLAMLLAIKPSEPVDGALLAEVKRR